MLRLFFMYIFLMLPIMEPFIDAQSIYRMKGITHIEPYTTASSIQVSKKWYCGMKCIENLCRYFTYEDGWCRVFDPKLSSGFCDNSDVSNQIGNQSHPSALFRLHNPENPPVGTVNAALFKTAYGPHYSINLPSLAVDDRENSRFLSEGRAGWFIVDLGALYIIRSISIDPANVATSFFKSIKVYAGTTLVTTGDLSSYTEIACVSGEPNGLGSLSLTIDSDTAWRYVAIKSFEETQHLALKDVKVMAILA